MTKNNSKLSSPYPSRLEVHAHERTSGPITFPTRRELHGKKRGKEGISIPSEIVSEYDRFEADGFETNGFEDNEFEANGTPPLPIEEVGGDPQVSTDVSGEYVYPKEQSAPEEVYSEEVFSKMQPDFNEIISPPNKTPSKKPILPIIALITASVGLVFGIIPGFLIAGWVLLPIALILSIVALAISRKKILSVIALILSVLGIVASALAFFFFVGNAIENDFEEVEVQQSEEVVVIETSFFGSKHTWSDGVAVTVSEPSYFKLSDTEKEQSLEMGLTPLIFTVEVENGTDQELESSGFYTSVISAEKEAEPLYTDSEELVFLGETIKPGESLTYRVAYLVENPVSLKFSWQNLNSEEGIVVFNYDEVITNV